MTELDIEHLRTVLRGELADTQADIRALLGELAEIQADTRALRADVAPMRAHLDGMPILQRSLTVT